MAFKLLVTLLAAAGLMLILFGVLPLPSLAEQRQLRRLGKPKKRFDPDKLLIRPLAGKLAPAVRLGRYDREKLQADLSAAGFDLTPEIYLARSYVIAAGILLLALASALLHIYLLTAVWVVFAVVTFFRVRAEVYDRLKAMRAEIEKELLQFMRTVIQSLMFSRDLPGMLDKYRAVAGSALRGKLDVLVVEMKAGNREEALSHFEKSVGIPYLTTFVTGLISQSRGVDQQEFLRSTEADMKKLSVEKLRKEAFKKPGKLHISQFILVLSILVVWLTAIGIQVFSGLAVFNNF